MGMTGSSRFRSNGKDMAEFAEIKYNICGVVVAAPCCRKVCHYPKVWVSKW